MREMMDIDSSAVNRNPKTRKKPGAREKLSSDKFNPCGCRLKWKYR
jgi:hypothetical protein